MQQVARSLGSPGAVNDWLRERWHIVPDPLEYEYIVAPALQLDKALQSGGQLVGDCDDSSVLTASLLAAIDWPCRFVAIRNRHDTDFSHVFVRAPILPFDAGISAAMQLDIDPIVPESALPLAGDFEVMTVSV